jgi:hypothetical protein
MKILLTYSKSCRKGYDDREREDPCVCVIHCAGRPDFSTVKAPSRSPAVIFRQVYLDCNVTQTFSPIQGEFAHNRVACVIFPGSGLVRDKSPERRRAKGGIALSWHAESVEKMNDATRRVYGPILNPLCDGIWSSHMTSGNCLAREAWVCKSHAYVRAGWGPNRAVTNQCLARTNLTAQCSPAAL